MSELFPLPAVIFLCCLLLLLVILAIVYFVVLKRDLCAGYLTGHDEHNIEEGQTLLNHENGEPTKNGGAENVEETIPAQPPATPGHSVPQEGNTEPPVGGMEEEQPGPSSSGTKWVDGGGEANLIPNGTPLSTAPPPPSTSHEKENSPVAETTIESTGDVGFIETEEEPLCRGGKVLVSFTYMPAANKLNMKVIRMVDLPSVEVGGADTVQVHLCVLPMRKQRYRTKQIPVSQSQAIVNQTFLFVHMTSDMLDTSAIRLRVYGAQRFSKRIIGETRVPLSKIDLTSPLADGDIWKMLAPKGMVAKHFGIDEEDEVDDDIDDWAD